VILYAAVHVDTIYGLSDTRSGAIRDAHKRGAPSLLECHVVTMGQAKKIAAGEKRWPVPA
jgi:hypothetical protein